MGLFVLTPDLAKDGKREARKIKNYQVFMLQDVLQEAPLVRAKEDSSLLVPSSKRRRLRSLPTGRDDTGRKTGMIKPLTNNQ